MSVISIFSGSFTKAEQVVDTLSQKTGYTVISDEMVFEKACDISDLDREAFERAVFGKPSVFNRFTHEKERAIACLKKIIADHLSTCNNCIFFGYLGQLIPKEIGHVLRCLIIADGQYRKKVAAESQEISEDAAGKLIRKDDEIAYEWTKLLHDEDAWAPSLYDIIAPAEKMDLDQIVELINDNLQKSVVQVSDKSVQAVENFVLASNVQDSLAKIGHDVLVEADAGKVTVIINHQVLLLSKLELELKEIVGGLEGVESVETRVGKKFHQADVYRRYDFEAPSRVLLVDDESEFVQVLSERLQARELGSHVVYDGKQALDVLKDEEPEVMVVDLKMPGIDGFEVLKQVKETNPDVEVIILTGQGSDADEKRCMELGAFAYLQKPVDIDQMTNAMNAAYAKIRSKK